MLTRPSVAVIGAGLAGACSARALAASGCDVTVIEQYPLPAQGASGNPIGILHPLVSKDHNLASQWVEAGMATTLRWLDELSADFTQVIGQRSGVAQLDAEGCHLIHWSAEGAWIRPAQWVKACLLEAVAHGAKLVFNRAVHDIQRLTYEFDHLVLCHADAIHATVPWAELRLNSIRGTISRYAIPDDQSLPHIICASGYATPVIAGEMIVGASFERLDENSSEPVTDIDLADSMSNLDRLRIISPSLAGFCSQLQPIDRTSIRSATHDRMPHVGQLLDLATPLRPSVSRLAQMPRSKNLWILGGLGSRGLSSAPLGAEILAARITGRHHAASLVPSLSEKLLGAIDPVRFALRRHQRRS